MSVSPVLYLQDSSLSGLLVGEKSAYLPKRGEEISFYPLPGCCSLSSTFYHEYLSCCFLFTFWSFQASFLCIRIVTGIKQLPQVLFSPGLLLLPHMVIFSCTACSSLDVSVLGELRSTNIHVLSSLSSRLCSTGYAPASWAFHRTCCCALLGFVNFAEYR